MWVYTTKWQTAAAGWGRAAEGGRKKDEGDPPVIAGATWGPTRGLEADIKVTCETPDTTGL